MPVRAPHEPPSSLSHRPSTRARRADRQISSRPHPSLREPTVRQRARVEALDLRHRRGVPADALLARAPPRRPDPARPLRPRRAALPLAHVAVRVHRTGRGVHRALPPLQPSRRRARAGHQTTRDAPSHRGGGIAGHPDLPLRGRPPRSMARARRFIRSSETSKRRASRPDLTPSSPRSSFPAFSPRNRRRAFTMAGVRFGDKVFTLLAGARLFWSHGARSVVPAVAGVVGSLVAEWAVTGRGWTLARVGVRDREGDVREGARGGRR